MPSMAGAGAAGGRGVQNTTAPALWRGWIKQALKKTTNCDKRVEEKDMKTWVIKKEEVTGAGVCFTWQEW